MMIYYMYHELVLSTFLLARYMLLYKSVISHTCEGRHMPTHLVRNQTATRRRKKLVFMPEGMTVAD